QILGIGFVAAQQAGGPQEPIAVGRELETIGADTPPGPSDGPRVRMHRKCRARHGTAHEAANAPHRRSSRRELPGSSDGLQVTGRPARSLRRWNSTSIAFRWTREPGARWHMAIFNMSGIQP